MKRLNQLVVSKMMKHNSILGKSISSSEMALCNFLRATISLYEAMIKRRKYPPHFVCDWNQDDEYIIEILKLLVDYQQLLLKKIRIYFKIFGLDYMDLHGGNDLECLKILQETVLKLEAHFFYKINPKKVTDILNQLIHYYNEKGFRVGGYTDSPHPPSPPWLLVKKVKVKKNPS